MTQDHDAAASAVSSPKVSGVPAQGFATVAWFAAYFNRPYSADAVAARLPVGADLSDPVMLSRALEAIGLKARLIKGAPKSIDPIALPYVLLRAGQTPLVLTAMGQGR